MRNSRAIVLWLLAGVAGLVLLIWAYPRAFPFLPGHWSTTRAEATDIALERFRDLGEPVKDPYVVTRLQQDYFLERRLQLALDRGQGARVWASDLPRRVTYWEVYVYPQGARISEWTYLGYVSLSGEVLGIRLRLDPQVKAPSISQPEARQRADDFLARQGIDRSRYGEPEIRSEQLAGRTDLTVRYPDRVHPLPAGSSHGIHVRFAGNLLAGFGPWLDDPQEKELARSLRAINFLGLSRILWIFLFAGALAFPFLKRYHEGEIGVRRGVQIFLLVAGLGLLLFLFSSRPDSQNNTFGFATREQNTALFMLFGMVFYMLPAAVLSFFAWSVGESVCRERWGHKLAAFDALFRGRLGNGTVARSAFQGWTAALAIAGVAVGLLAAVRTVGGWPFSSLVMSGDSLWPGLVQVAGALCFELPFYLAIVLWLLPSAARRLGVWAGSGLTVLVAALAIPAMSVIVPLGWTLVLSALFGVFLVLLFLYTDLFTALLAALVSHVLFAVYPMLTAADGSLQLQGWLALGILAVPLVASVRYLGSGREHEYRYEDVPPHVRRIAERERQRVELETARGIQSSILPDLPARLAGVDLAHAYLPASEVGGDFYDVLALEDGRLAVAVGDVAGHGVSSGLVMSMAKSALAVQVTFDPEVAAVFNTLNRTVYQSARKRLLTTLCYAVIDPRRLEMIYASAGHLHPYRISAAGQVEPLESVAYPLGVRGLLPIEARTARLTAGDTLFLFSDGVVEARREGSDEMFGFERLEESLARHVGRGPEGMRDGVLADVARFTANSPREDDQTIVVLRLP
ncbi:MAG TPA: PP2C family protein-serine/threonine phosphatase [Thermoanaerobaculia bacterium]|nr:PP2C family protein-serine/threonine phosphatase [Thermoanaerobaculia bacterium]